MNFLSNSKAFELMAEARSILDIDPNNLSPEPTLDGNLISRALIFSALALASSIIDFSLNARCLRFSARTLRAETVAITPFPLGIRKLRP